MTCRYDNTALPAFILESEMGGWICFTGSALEATIISALSYAHERLCLTFMFVFVIVMNAVSYGERCRDQHRADSIPLVPHVRSTW